MEQERSHDQYPTGGDETWHRLSALQPFPGRRRVEPSAEVGTGNDSQRPLIGVPGIELKSERDHALQDPKRGPDVSNTRLDRPGPIIRDRNPRTDGDRQILMPGDCPVRLGGFVEEQAPDGKRCPPEGRRDDCVRRWVTCERADTRNVAEQIPARVNAAFAIERGSSRTECVESGDQLGDGIAPENIGHNRESIVLERRKVDQRITLSQRFGLLSLAPALKDSANPTGGSPKSNAEVRHSH